jgi:hypothetical protein
MSNPSPPRYGACRFSQERRRYNIQPGQCTCVRQIGIYGSYNDTCFQLHQVNAPQRHLHPSVNHDAFVQHPIEHIYETRATGCVFDSHRGFLLDAALPCRP